jgi:hypothetical protein
MFNIWGMMATWNRKYLDWFFPFLSQDWWFLCLIDQVWDINCCQWLDRMQSLRDKASPLSRPPSFLTKGWLFILGLPSAPSEAFPIRHQNPWLSTIIRWGLCIVIMHIMLIWSHSKNDSMDNFYLYNRHSFITSSLIVSIFLQ